MGKSKILRLFRLGEKNATTQKDDHFGINDITFLFYSEYITS